MRIFQDPADLIKFLKTERGLGKKIGFVPTMGALHEGHLALIKAAQLANDMTVCSIFVNPTQFNNKEDLAKYPRPVDSDRQKLEEIGCDVLFLPSESQMYPTLPKLRFDFGELETVMEGKFRPGHFNGVGVVVSKLFSIVQPDEAYFGQKDYQQYMIISRLVQDLSFQVKLICYPIIRATDGLALSSRNMRLSEDARAMAPLIYKCLVEAKQDLESGKSIQKVKELVGQKLSENPNFILEYIEIADSETLETLTAFSPGQKAVICIAVFLDGIRLIDNILI